MRKEFLLLCEFSFYGRARASEGCLSQRELFSGAWLGLGLGLKCRDEKKGILLYFEEIDSKDDGK